MADAELDQIRKARLEQLKAQGGGGPGSQGGGGGGGGGMGGQNQAEQQRQQEAEARQAMLGQILQPEAADRLGRIRLVKEARAAEVEDRLIALARSGQLRQRVTEAQLKDLLSALADGNGQGGSGGGGVGRIVVDRRKAWDDEDEDDLLDL